MFQWLGQSPPATPPSVLISPKGFKASLQAFLAVLADHQCSGVIWAKLPSGSLWLEDLQRYAEAVRPRPTIHLFTRHPLTLDWCQTLPLPTSCPLRGEYGLVALTSIGSAMVLAQRRTEPQEMVTTLHQDDPSASATQAKVDFCFTVQPAALQSAIASIHGLLTESLAEYPENPVVADAIARWTDLNPNPTQLDSQVLEGLVMRVCQQQEHLRQQTRSFRRQAMTANQLSTQNEALMNTLRLKDDFLNTVGQALRTPLSTIKTALPLLSSPNLKPPQRQRYLDMVSHECDRQRTLINGVLDLLQIEQSLATIKPRPINLFDVVPGVVSTYQPIAQEKGVRLAYTIPDNLPATSCPEAWLRQIVIHLLSNSIKYTESGGEVWVTAQVASPDAIALHVKDTGIGIPASELPRIFDHFYRGRQVNQEEEGAGLGLTIVQQLLLYCGGEVRVESQVGTGSHFQVLLPIAHRSPASSP